MFAHAGPPASRFEIGAITDAEKTTINVFVFLSEYRIVAGSDQICVNLPIESVIGQAVTHLECRAHLIS